MVVIREFSILKQLMCVSACYILLSCSNSGSEFTQSRLNNFASKALAYSIDNKCFTYPHISENYISVCRELALIFPNEKVNGLDITSFVQDSTNLQKFDTVSISPWSEKRIIHSDYSEIQNFLEFQRNFSKKMNSNQSFAAIKSYIISNPYLLSQNGKNYILFKILLYFEYSIDSTYILLTTNKNYEMENIECFQPFKPYIPKPPKYDVENFKE